MFAATLTSITSSHKLIYHYLLECFFKLLLRDRLFLFGLREWKTQLQTVNVCQASAVYSSSIESSLLLSNPVFILDNKQTT